jgi:hypothetical protein
MAKNIRKMIEHNANTRDLIAYFNEKNFPSDDVAMTQLAKKSLRKNLTRDT